MFKVLSVGNSPVEVWVEVTAAPHPGSLFTVPLIYIPTP